MTQDGLGLTADVERNCQVAVIGSGAGGAMVARGLSARGVQVVLVEEGGHQSSRDFDMQEQTAYPLLYQDRGNRATADLSILVLQGRTVGGGTVVNWTTSFRTPSRVLEHWQSQFGVEGLTEETLKPHWEEAESYLSIQSVAMEDVNQNNSKLWNGLGALGWQRELLRRNVRGCMRSGYCGLGCPVDAKRSMLITAIPDALARGAELYSHLRATRLTESRGRIVRVDCEVIDPQTSRPTGRRVVLHPQVCVLSGGALNSPALLLRSQIGNRSGQLGFRTFLHPTLAMVGAFEEPVEGFYGVPQSVASHQFSDRGSRMGYFFETPPLHPMLAALAFNDFGRNHREVITRLAHSSAVIGLCIDGFDPSDAGGRVTLKSDGGPRLDYPFSERLAEAARSAQRDATRILLAAGATEVSSLHTHPIVVRKEADLPRLAESPFFPNALSVFTAHQMGGCAMGSDPERSVVRSDLRHHDLENLFVVDGSVFPTSLGVNPQLTIYGLAGYAVPHIARALS